MKELDKDHWERERDASDAPVWFSADEANAWASGWNAAVEAAHEKLKTVLLKEPEA